jgi:predicted transposase YdaD
MVYKFTNLSRQEIDAMLGIKLEETRVYREARQEAKDEAREEERGKIALNLLRKNIPLETIAEVTELTIDRLHQLQASIENDRSN